eukprot:s1647_g6.t1
MDSGALLWRCEKGGLISWLITRPGQVSVVMLNISARLHLSNLMIKARMLSGTVAYEATWPSDRDVTLRALRTKIRESMLAAGRILATHRAEGLRAQAPPPQHEDLVLHLVQGLFC